MKRYLIIGNGVAGTSAAEQIRKHDNNGDITIISDEKYPFYYRIRLNEYISGDIDKNALTGKKAEWYAEQKIQLITGVSVTGADPAKQYIITDSGQKYFYDFLLIATGSRSFVPPIQGVNKKGVFTLRTLNDAGRIVSFCEKIDKVVLIGGGLLGLETGNALRKKGKQVTVVEFFPRLLPKQLDTRGAERLKKIMENMGFSFRLGATTKKITGTNVVESVMLENEKSIPADMVIMSAGVRPNLELGQLLGLSCNKGIIVDSALKTSNPTIFAAGDVAEFENVLYGIWPAAMQQGRTAGTNMAGGAMAYQGSVMANKLKVIGIDLASAGEIDVENRFTSKIEETDTVYKKIVFDNHRIIGCIMLGDTSDFNTFTRLIAEKNIEKS